MKNGGDLAIRAWRSGDLIHIEVRDTGCGILKSQRHRIFQPFYTTRAESGGSGLGLSTAQSIVSSHRGVITVESTPGEGTTFLVSFPALEPAPVCPEEQVAPFPSGS